MVWRPFCHIWIESLSHDWRSVSYTVLNWQFLHRCLSWCELVATTKWVIDRWTTDRTVKDGLQAFLTRMVKIRQNRKGIWFKRVNACCSFFWKFDVLIHYFGINDYAHTVCIKETTFQVNNGFTIPMHDKIWFFSHCCHNNSVNIFFITFCNEGIYVFRTHHNCHPFLWFRDGNFCTIQALVFKRNLVEVDFKTICQFTDSHTDTTCSKVIGFLDETSDISITEKTLNLALFDGIPFLNLSTSSLHRLNCLNLRRPCRTTDTVTSSLTTEQDNYVTSFRFFTDYIALRSSTNNGTKFHAFSYKAWVEIFTNVSRCKTNLVTIWRITVSRCLRNDLLWQFPSASFRNRSCNITSAWDTHSLVNVWTPWQWVTNSPTDTSSRPTKWLNFRWVIVGFVLEHEEPRFLDTINVHFDFNRTGIDFVRHFHIVQTTISTLITTKNSRHIHQGLWLFRPT